MKAELAHGPSQCSLERYLVTIRNLYVITFCYPGSFSLFMADNSTVQGSSKDIGFDDPHVRVLRLNTPTPPSNSSRGEVDLHVV